MDHYMEPLSSQAIVDEDNQDAIVNANVAELESQYKDDNSETLTATPVKANNENIPTQPSAPKKPRKNPTSTGTHGGKQPASSKRKLQFTDDDVEEEDEQPSSLGKNT